MYAGAEIDLRRMGVWPYSKTYPIFRPYLLVDYTGEVELFRRMERTRIEARYKVLNIVYSDT